LRWLTRCLETGTPVRGAGSGTSQQLIFTTPPFACAFLKRDAENGLGVKAHYLLTKQALCGNYVLALSRKFCDPCSLKRSEMLCLALFLLFLQGAFV
jgi:hypothetical protein